MTPAEEMEMDMKDRLAGIRAAVDHNTVSVLRDAFLFG